MSQRVKQIESTLQRAVSQVIQRGINDPRIRGLISVTRVDASPDIKSATVYVSILPEQHAGTTMKGLVHATRHVQSELRNKLTFKTVPHLTFKLDETLKRQAEVFAEIDEGMRRSGPEPDPESTDTPDDPQETRT